MTEKTDRRKLRTKRLLRQALLELIEEKGMDGITVSDLTDRAGINRGTFYLHYRDAADLLERLKEEILSGLLKHMEQINPLEHTGYAEKGQPYPASVKVLEYIEKHADFFKVIFGPKGDLSFPLQIKEFMKNHLLKEILKDMPQSAHATVPRDYLIAYITSAHLGLLMHWFETGRKIPASEVALIITRIIHDGPLAVTGLKL